jgi:site-specific DNA-methyltransferase (adenine-specific)
MATYLHGDCLEVMKTLPDKSVDCFVCDLPYGQLQKDGCSWDMKLDLNAFWTQVKRLCKDDHTPVLMFCNTKFGFDLYNSNPAWFRYDLVWDKERGVSFLLANKMPMKSHEMVYIFSKKGSFYKRTDDDAHGKTQAKKSVTARSDKVYSSRTLSRSQGAEDGKKCVTSVIRCKKVGTVKDLHPTQKPQEIYRWLLERYCPEGGTVLDPTAGSFNSITVAKGLGLKAIGIERDADFFWKAVQKSRAQR